MEGERGVESRSVLSKLNGKVGLTRQEGKALPISVVLEGMGLRCTL